MKYIIIQKKNFTHHIKGKDGSQEYNKLISV